MFSHEMLTGITGDPVWADRTEEIAFNSLPASMTADLKGLHYITSPNQVQLDAANKAPMIQRTGDMFSHDPHGYRCCQHNAAFGWPYFAEYSWMATRDNGLAAVLYAPGRVTAKVADGAEVTITETTDYPFDEAVTMRVSIAKPTKFPLLLRVPAWCDRPSLALNGKGLEVAKGAKGWLVVDRVWSKGDSVRLVLPMRITTRVWTENRNTVSVDRGPLTYSLKIGERWQKSGGTAEWPAFEVYPTTPWNYGLVVDPAKPEAAFEFVKAKGPLPAQPFNVDSAPVALLARAQRIPQWKMEPNGMVGEVQPGPVRSGEPVEKITLIPMGAARLRISAFPRVSAGPTAQTWHEQYPIAFSSSSSHYYPPSAALDGVVPSTSKDPKVRRFVWSKPKPEANYIEYRFSSPVRLSSAEVYWAEDDGECRLPASWSVSFLDGDRWRPVEGASGYATDRDKFNATRFIPVSTNAIRLEVRVQDQRTAGIMEWKVSE
jgi:hypothetical protein